jgi:hypothetical protein
MKLPCQSYYSELPAFAETLCARRLYKKEEFPLFGYLFPAAQAGKRGEGRFSQL